jgi:hypothetical protein
MQGVVGIQNGNSQIHIGNNGNRTDSLSLPISPGILEHFQYPQISLLMGKSLLKITPFFRLFTVLMLRDGVTC